MALPSGQNHLQPLQPGDVLVVVHDFDARSGDELTLRRSERVELIELDDGFSDGWYLGKHLTRGGTGLFPGVYTTRAPSTLRTPPHSRNQSAYLEATTDQGATKLSPSPAGNFDSPRPLSTPQQSASAFSEPGVDLARSSLPAPHHTNYVQRTIGETLGERERGQDSPVMNETLNVIDEHITDLSTPRQRRASRRHRDDSESEYSTHLDRQSFMTGPETDEEDGHGLDEATVRSWDHHHTAQYLESIGLDPAHCQIFREQEISGDVLLDMDQNFLYMKEYDFGVMGRRLKTWHKVREFQREVKFTSKRASDRGHNSSHEDVDRSTMQSLSGPAPLARAQDRGLSLRQTQQTPPVSEESSDVPYPLQTQPSSKRASWAAQTPPSSWRATLTAESPTAAMNSTSSKSRRHSSIDFGAHPDLELSSLHSPSSHKKQSSWSLTGSTVATTPSSSIQPNANTGDSTDIPSARVASSPLDVDRGYFSSNDIDSRKNKNRLSKGPRIGHSRQTSMAEQSTRASIVKRHARLSSTGSIQGQPISRPSGASQAYHEIPSKGRMRSASARVTSSPSPAGLSPAVTNLENDSSSNISSPAIEKMKMQDRARKLMGFRATSDAITPEEKSSAARLTPILDGQHSDIVASPTTGNTTPSGTPSVDMDTPEESVKGVETPSLSKPSLKPRPRTKQYTSAYTHGLLKIPPSEARKQCDHHGWMKKKSSGIMTTWKPRLFILRGRRLSYYYSENDTEERGIIDISSHKVLVANDDPMITIHASVTGATKPTSTPRLENQSSPPVRSKSMIVFYFKLVPPKSGLSRAVQFTKPAVHYFQVDTIEEGRKWMGELMKATIEHDLTSFETTNKQKTISLAKARARHERPPDLTDTKKIHEEKVEDEKTLEDSGLKIQGLESQEPNITQGHESDPPNAPKALSTTGLGPRNSLDSKSEEHDQTIPKEDKENNSTAARLSVIPETKA